MPDLSGSAALDVLIGLSFVYLVLSIVCSAIWELFASGRNLRGRELERGIRSMVEMEDPSAKFAPVELVDRFYEHPQIRALTEPGAKRRPSYLPPRAVARTFLDLLPELGGRYGRDPASIQFRVAQDFDDLTRTIRDWYKRRVQIGLVVIATVIAVGFNVDTLAIGDSLMESDALSAAVITQAAELRSTAACQSHTDQCLDEIGDEVEVLGIPGGWTPKTTPDDVGEGLDKLAGLLITVAVLSLLAPVLYDVRKKLSRGALPPRHLPAERQSEVAAAPAVALLDKPSRSREPAEPE